MEHTLICLLRTIRRGNKHFDFHIRRINPKIIPSKDGKDAFYEECKG